MMRQPSCNGMSSARVFSNAKCVLNVFSSQFFKTCIL